MKVTNMYNTDTSESYVLVESELLRKYYTNFLGLFLLGKQRTKALESIILERINESSVKVIISSKKDSKEASPIGMILPFPTVTAMSINKDTIDAIDDVINKFVETASIRKTNTTEIIPLTGYNEKKLKAEVRNAVEKKRNLILIDSYQTWLNTVQAKSLDKTFEQYEIKYGTLEYANVVLSILEDKLYLINEKYKNKLKTLPWF